MTCYPILAHVSLFLASVVLAVLTWVGSRLMRPECSRGCLWIARSWSLLTVGLAFVHGLLCIFPALQSGSLTDAFAAWMPPATHTALLILALINLWIALLMLRREERLRAELGSAQHRTERLLDRLPDLCFSVDSAGNVAAANAAVRPLLGYDPSELTGKSFDDLIFGGERDAVRRGWAEFSRAPNNHSDYMPVTLQSREGEPVNVLISVSVRRDAEGHFAGVEGIARDNRAALAYEQAMREQAGKMENLFSLALAMGSSLDLNEQLEQLLTITQRAIGYDSASVFVLEEDGEYRALAQRGYADPDALRDMVYREVGLGQLEIMRQTRCPHIIADTTQDPGWVVSKPAPEIRSWMGAPLCVRDEMIGVINLDCRQANRYGEVDAKLLGSIAGQAAAAIQNARLFGQVQEQAKRLGQLTEGLLALQAASVTLAQASNVPQTLRMVRLIVRDLIADAHPAFFVLSDEAQESTELIRLDAEDDAYLAVWREAGVLTADGRFPLPDVEARRKIPLNRKPLVTKRFKALFGHLGPAEMLDELQDRFKVETVVTLPMWSRERLLGYMLVGRRQGDFSDRDLELLSALSNIAAVTVSNVQLLEDLQRTSGELDKVISSSMDAIVVVGEAGRVNVWNPAAERTFGLPATEMLGRSLGGLQRSAITTFMRDISGRVLAGEQVTLRDQELTLHGGRRVWLSGHAAPMFDGDGDVMGAIFVIQDVTQERAAKRQLQQTEKLSALGQLAAGVAHELNNPLTSIIGYAQLLHASAGEPEVQGDLDRIIKQGKRAARIVQNLLTFVGEHEPRRVPTDVNDVLRTAVEMRQYELSAGNIAVTMDLAPDLPITLADYHQLQQVFFNLLLNAEQAMTETHDSGQVIIRSRLLNGDTIRVTMQDDGPGIPPQILSRIFDPFFTTKIVGKGTGLGLSICYGIVEEHGGAIWAESEAGQGATFIVELPVVEVTRKS